MIYFAQPTNGGPIRIGCTEQVDKRAVQLGQWIVGGVEIMARMPGSFFTEAILLRVFEPIRVEKDWFRSCPVMWRFIMYVQNHGAPEWLPTTNMYPKDMEPELLREFGSLEAAAKALGYSSPITVIQAAKACSDRAYGFSSRMWVHLAMKHQTIPADLVDLHDMARAA